MTVGRLLLFALGLMCIHRPADAAPRAQPADSAGTIAPLRVLVICQNAPDCQRRVAGQLADLDGVTQSSAPYDSTTQGRYLSEASRDDATFDVVAVLLAQREPDGQRQVEGAYSIIRYQDSAQLYERRLGPPLATASARDNSATLEMFALAVRAATKSLLLERAQRQPSPQLEAAAKDDRPSKADETSVGLFSKLGAGARISAPSTLHRIVELGGGLTTEVADWLVAVRWLPSTTIDVGQARVNFTHVELGLAGALTLVRRGPWSGQAIAGAWIVWPQRSTSSDSRELAPTPDASSLTFAASFDVALRYEVTATEQLSFQLGLDWFPRSTRFAIASSAEGAQLDALTLWSLRPRAALSWMHTW